jgi:hypothetical protein
MRRLRRGKFSANFALSSCRLKVAVVSSFSGHLAAMMGPSGGPGGVVVGYPPRTPAQARVCTAPSDVPAPCPRSSRGYRSMVRVANGSAIHHFSLTTASRKKERAGGPAGVSKAGRGRVPVDPVAGSPARPQPCVCLLLVVSLGAPRRIDSRKSSSFFFFFLVGWKCITCVIAPLRPLSNDGQTNHIPVGWGTRAPGGLGMRVGVQSNPSLTMSPQGRGIRRGGHHLPGCFSDIARVPNTRSSSLKPPRAPPFNWSPKLAPSAHNYRSEEL